MMVRDNEKRVIRLEFDKKNINYFLFELSQATSRANLDSNSAHLATEPN
jgi:hypothetical protein